MTEEGYKRLIVELPKSLHDRLRMAAALEGTTIKSLVIRAIEPMLTEIPTQPPGGLTND